MSECSKFVALGRPMLDYLLVGLFVSVMVLTGLSVAWHLAQERCGTPEWVPQVIAMAVSGFVPLLIAYWAKLVTAPKTVLAEFQTAGRRHLFGTVHVRRVQASRALSQRHLFSRSRPQRTASP